MGKILLTGASGYIGGQVLYELAKRLPNLPITAILRDAEKAELVRKSYPHVDTVVGNLDDAQLLKREASQASIVMHLAATGHLGSVRAIHEGLKLRPASDPVYWIQVSGASALAAGEIASSEFVPGSPSSKVFDDVSGISDIQSLIREHRFRAVDNLVLDVAAENSHIRTALVLGPIIYGEGQGPVNKRSIQVPELSRVTLSRGHGVRVGQGLNRWGNVHVRDVGKLFSALAEAAASNNNDEMLWGQNGIYLAGVGEMTFRDISTRVVEESKDLGLIQDARVEEMDKSTSDQLLPHGSVLFGTNARGSARRAREVLRWEPTGESLEQDIARAVADEAGRLGRL